MLPRPRAACASALILLALGCSKPDKAPPPAPSAGTATAASATAARRASDEFFAGWLRAHGETSVVTDADGVGVAGNDTRLRSSLYGSTKHGDSTYVIETEFRVRVPGGREVVDYVAGIGATQEAGEDDTRHNFITTTFHVLYRSFINPADAHQSEKPLLIQGTPRSVVMGDLGARGPDGGAPGDFSPVQAAIEKLLSTLTLSAQPHWIKIVYAQSNGVADTVAGTLDNADDAPLTAGVRALPWPKQTEFYLAKQFIVVK